MIEYKKPEFKVKSDDSKFRISARGEVQFHMAGLMNEINATIISSLTNAGMEAETSLKASHIIRYYSILRQLFNNISPLMSKDDFIKYKHKFGEIREKLNIQSKSTKYDEGSIVTAIQTLQLDLFEFMQTKRLLYSIRSERGSFDKFKGEMLT